MIYSFKNVSDAKIEEAKKIIHKNGGSMNDGFFSVSGVDGRYEKEGNKLTISIDSKPWLASWGLIEKKLTAFFG